MTIRTAYESSTVRVLTSATIPTGQYSVSDFQRSATAVTDVLNTSYPETAVCVCRRLNVEQLQDRRHCAVQAPLHTEFESAVNH